jgi:hypothetical protein
MAQCYCYSIYNDSPTTSYEYYYTDCNTGLPETGGVGPNSTVYTCSLGAVSSNGGIVSINVNDTPCGGCECGCETFTGFKYKGGGGTISITYTNCNNFTGQITNIIVPPAVGESTYLFADNFPFNEQPSFCAKVGTSITETGSGVGEFVPQFGDCCFPSFTVYLVSDCCDEKPDGYMYLPVGLLPNQVVGSSTDNTCYKIVEGAEAVENLDWDGSVFPVGQCDECQTTNEYFCDPEPPTPTPTSTKTPTPTPTITPTPTLTPTPTSQPTTIYFQRCCNISQYLGVYNYYGTIVSEYSYLSITIGANTFCVKTVSSVPYPVTLYDFNDGNIELSGYSSCEECKLEYPCPPPPTQQIMGYENECTVITIFPMSIECVSISPSTTESNDGRVSVSITGGTPPYKYTWEGDGIGNDNHAPAIDNVPIGDYTVTVVDYWGDFTATTTCTLTAYTDCYFSGTVSEFTPPTPTPTKTPTPTPTSIPSKCDCRYGTVGISYNDIILSDDETVYVSYLDCDGHCYCITGGIGGGKPYAEGIYPNDICVDTTTNGIGVSLYIIVDGEPQLLPLDGDSYVTLGGCCTTPTQSQTPTPTPTQTLPLLTLYYRTLNGETDPYAGDGCLLDILQSCKLQTSNPNPMIVTSGDRVFNDPGSSYFIGGNKVYRLQSAISALGDPSYVVTINNLGYVSVLTICL